VNLANISELKSPSNSIEDSLLFIQLSQNNSISFVASRLINKSEKNHSTRIGLQIFSKFVLY